EEISKNSKKYKILEFLSKKKAKLREIANFIRLKDSSTSYYLEKMQEKGYIRRNGYYYEITETGKLILYIIKILYGKSESYINSSRISRNSYRSYRILTKEI
ncbi:MAG: winged helix-turn-helix domain-containing protein, partial [Candidatus Aenigmatarchaeota archaeon]